MNYRNKFDSLLRRPSKLASLLPLFSISASLSIKSTISLVKLQSNSLTVHLVCNSTSSLSSVLRKGSRRPLNKSMSSLARVENGVCTSVKRPSLRFHSFGSLIARRKFAIFSDLFFSAAVIFNLSICYKILVSLFSNYWSASFFSSALGSLEFLIFLVSLSRQASSSLNRISKSLPFLGCMRLSISIFLFLSSSSLSSSYLRLSSASLSSRIFLSW